MSLPLKRSLTTKSIRVLLTLLTFFAFAAVIGAESLARGDSGTSRTNVRSLAEIVDSGKLVMLTFPHQQSTFSRLDLGQGAMPRVPRKERFAGVDAIHFEGIDVELMSLFAERLGVYLEVRPVSEPSYGALIPDLLAGRGDLIASSLTITEERQRKVDFSVPYFTVYPVILTRKGSAIESLEDLEGTMGSVMEGSSHEERLLGLGVDPASLLRVDFTVAAVGAVVDGDVDYTLQDSMAARRLVASHPELEIAFRLDEVEEYGIALPKGSELADRLDAFLAEMKDSGRLQEIMEKYGEG